MTLMDKRPAGTVADKVAARGELVEARRLLAEWETKEAAARESLARLEILDAAALADPDSADRLGPDMAGLRGEQSIAARGVQAQRQRVFDAETRYVAACLAVAEEQHRAAVAAVEQHEAKTQRLLDQLRRHDGPYVPRSMYQVLLMSVGTDVLSEPFEAPKVEGLRQQVILAERSVELLRSMIEGRDPQAIGNQWTMFGVESWAPYSPEEYLPDSLQGPNAVVPWRAYVQRRRQA